MLADTPDSTDTPQFVRVRLGDLQPNPFRKIGEYPLNPEKVRNLKQSIEATGFWKNVPVRPSPAQPGKYEICYGHHRLEAGIQALGKDYEHFLPLEYYSDYSMMLVLTHENSDDWTSPVEHWMLVVDVTRDWLEAAIERDGDAIEREIIDSFKTGGSIRNIVCDQNSPVVKVFTTLYSSQGWAMNAFHSCRERGVESLQIAKFLGDRFVSKSQKSVGVYQYHACVAISRAFDLLPSSPKRANYLRAEAQRKEQVRISLEMETRKAEAERRDRARAEQEARSRVVEESRLRREAEKRQQEEQARAQAALRAHYVAKHEEERQAAQAEHELAEALAGRFAAEQEERGRLEQEAHRKATREHAAGEEQERRLKELKIEREKQERVRLREQQMFERLQQDDQVDPEAIRLCNTWSMAKAFRDKVLDPRVQQYLPKDRQKDLLLDIIATKQERLTPDVLTREIDVRLGRVERVAAEVAKLGTKIERAAEDVAAKVRATRRAFEALHELVEQAQRDRNHDAMVSAIAAISHANFSEVVRTIDDIRKDAEALAGIASPRPSSGWTPDSPSFDRPSITLVAG